MACDVRCLSELIFRRLSFQERGASPRMDGKAWISHQRGVCFDSFEGDAYILRRARVQASSQSHGFQLNYVQSAKRTGLDIGVGVGAITTQIYDR